MDQPMASIGIYPWYVNMPGDAEKNTATRMCVDCRESHRELLVVFSNHRRKGSLVRGFMDPAIVYREGNGTVTGEGLRKGYMDMIK